MKKSINAAPMRSQKPARGNDRTWCGNGGWSGGTRPTMPGCGTMGEPVGSEMRPDRARARRPSLARRPALERPPSRAETRRRRWRVWIPPKGRGETGSDGTSLRMRLNPAVTAHPKPQMLPMAYAISPRMGTRYSSVRKNVPMRKAEEGFLERTGESAGRFHSNPFEHRHLADDRRRRTSREEKGHHDHAHAGGCEEKHDTGTSSFVSNPRQNVVAGRRVNRPRTPGPVWGTRRPRAGRPRRTGPR